ncbi:MAG: VWA domain-containing protein [Spirochaetales bacterium]|nr:VWA domain-containing protein [Spirochaetales bacterium]
MKRATLKKAICLTLFFTLSVGGLCAEELIQAAILLDTSSSMDGLINQAKTQLWKIVNELATAKRNGVSPALEVALYEYGNNNIPAKVGYIKRVLTLSRDLDKVSEALFALTTDGGSEYCGEVIQRASKELAWSGKSDVLKLIFIAGNEPFTQGRVDYRAACRDAVAKGIVVNTIFCGDREEGRRTDWLAGAELADGRYFSIDQDAAVAYVKAPQDDEIVRLNGELNKTYIAYGSSGEEGKVLQEAQDANAASSGAGTIVERSIAKSKTQYANERWDLVDAYRSGKADPAALAPEALPPELKGKTEAEQRAYIEAKAREREAIQKKIGELEKARRDFLEEEAKKQAGAGTLDSAIVASIREQAGAKKYVFEK